MSQDAEKYLYFKVGLLKDSFALEALWQDALRYHMIDQPAKLIALRLTEYYERSAKDLVAHPTANSPMSAASPTSGNGGSKEETEVSHTSSLAIRPSVTQPPTSSLATHSPATTSSIIRPPSPKITSTSADQADTQHSETEVSLTVSAEVDQNAEDAADYWSLL